MMIPMRSFKSRILQGKTISVWGSGYLGYTTVLHLQNQGFRVRMHDMDKSDLRAEIEAGTYPSGEQSSVWSRHFKAPPLNPELVTVHDDAADMFGVPVHIICLPTHWKDGTKVSPRVLDYFLDNKDRLDDCLILFVATEKPGGTQKHFIGPMQEAGARCSFACSPRSDWRLEEFMGPHGPRPVAGVDTESYCKAEIFYSLIGVETTRLATIKEAEVFECAKNALNYTVAAFINQLALSFPDTDVRNITPLLAQNISMDEVPPSLGSIGYKTAHSIEHLLSGLNGQNHMSTVTEAQSTNLSAILFYADKIKRAGVESVTILGLGTRGSLRDVALSPSLILAEYLHGNGVSIVVDDPNFSEMEIASLMPFARAIDLESDPVSTDAVVIMNDLESYRTFTQEELSAKGITTAKVVIDNAGIFQDFEFSRETLYHVPGDGNIG